MSRMAWACRVDRLTKRLASAAAISAGGRPARSRNPDIPASFSAIKRSRAWSVSFDDRMISMMRSMLMTASPRPSTISRRSRASRRSNCVRRDTTSRRCSTNTCSARLSDSSTGRPSTIASMFTLNEVCSDVYLKRLASTT